MGREWEACVMAKVGGETGRNAINIHRIIKLDPHFMPYTKINSKLIKYVNIWMEEPGRLQSMWSLRVGHD